MRRLQGESTAEVMTPAVFGPDTREMVRRLRGERAEVMNRILSGSGTQQQLLGRVRPEASVNVSRIVLSDSAFSGMRSALLSQSTVEAMAALANVGGTSATAQFVQTLRHLTDVNVRFAGLVSAAQSAQPTLAARSLGYYQNYIRDLPARPTAHQQLMSLTAGQGIGGIVASSALLIAETEEAVLALADEVDEVIIEPWRRGAAEARDALYSRLSVLDPGLPELLKGAWHETVTPGPAALVKMSTCIVEAIDRSLRAGAPDSDIEEWLPRSGRPRADFYTEEKPGQKQRLTRAARVRYILRDRKGERRLVEEQEAAVIAGVSLLQERLQAAKHASAGNLVTLQGQLLAAEGFLIQLFVSA
jgi:hypothetical protein